ncbi:Na[+]/H[+] hydrogen antiporter 1 [Strigomonas culicis]|uniref:Na[+]/H[+] hydrogen antiporter 1 n=1 Tax=Strigomonas culicis TaxID=28005 RepID=S9TR35_9TRYP|nr:Na[+]/H[+] hydrogen antiporter 1 [Strigomonas culicis]|eukprot:EPY20827.1 Na[+]/H[+] hydrogen antiporter 1 [Strigomonas culicis]
MDANQRSEAGAPEGSAFALDAADANADSLFARSLTPEVRGDRAASHDNVVVLVRPSAGEEARDRYRYLSLSEWPSTRQAQDARRSHSNAHHAAAPGDGRAQPDTSDSAGHHGGDSRKPMLPYSASFVEHAHTTKLPPHLLPLAHQIYQLDEDDLVFIADMAETVATKDVYSLLPYTGSNWFLPNIRECGAGERRWELRYSWHHGIIIALGGRRMSLRLLNIVIRLLFLVLLWFLAWNMLPRTLVQPGGYVWDPCVLIIVSAVVGGLVCRLLQIPPLVGVLWVGIMWNNIPSLHYLTGGIVRQVFDICSKLGLTVILARAGYSLSIMGILPHWKQSILLATLPFAIEGVAHSLLANRIFDYENDYNWAFLQGMLCSIVSPAVVVPGTLYLQELGYGRGIGPLSLMLSAVGVEIAVGVWCANFIIGLIFYDQALWLSVLLGPVQFIGGALLGIGFGFGFFYLVETLKREAARLPNGKYERQHFYSTLDLSFFIFISLSFTMVFFGYKENLAGGGCTMCVLFAATVSHLWLRDGVKEYEQQKKYLGNWLAFTWDQVMMPVLFATMGAKISITAIFNASFFPKCIIILACSTAVRFIVIFLLQLGSGMPYKEKLLVCVGYLGKASAQASVGPIAANLVAERIAALTEAQQADPATMAKYAKLQTYANYVQQMSAAYVMILAAVASLGLVRGGMRVLTKEGPGGAQAEPATGGSGSGAEGRELNPHTAPDSAPGEDGRGAHHPTQGWNEPVEEQEPRKRK